MAMTTGNGSGVRSDINITPLVDVLLVLLVLFIVTAPTVTHSLAIDLPQRVTGAPPPNQEALRLHIGAGDVYELNGVAMDRHALAIRFATAAASGTPAAVEVSADPEADYQSVLRPMADARAAGLQNLVFVNH